MDASGAEPTAPVYNRVPKVTVDFWLIKLLAVTVGETAADFLADDLGFGLPVTSLIMSAFLVVALALQFARRRYVPWAYWLAVVLVSIVGTLITDNMVDNFGVALEVSTAFFTVALAAVFAAWYGFERTLSIHTIYTTRREAFYWLAILLTFALGTAGGDLAAEGARLGYLVTGLVFAVLIAAVAIAYYRFDLDGILAFWLVYILTRPLGASIGDLVSKSPKQGGLGYGTVITSFVFLACIAGVIVYMTASRNGEETAADLAAS